MDKNTRMDRKHLAVFLDWLKTLGFRSTANQDGSITMSAHFMKQPMLRNVTIWRDMRMNKGGIAMYQDFIAGVKEANLETQKFLKVT